MSKFHIGAKGPAKCRAILRACPFGGSEAHFASREEAEVALASEYTAFTAVKKVSFSEAKDSFNELRASDAAVNLKPRDPNANDKLLEDYLKGKYYGTEEVQENFEFLPPHEETSGKKKMSDRELNNILQDTEMYATMEAVQSLRRGILEVSAEALYYDQQGEASNARYYRGWSSALSDVLDRVTDDASKYGRTAPELLAQHKKLKEVLQDMKDDKYETLDRAAGIGAAEDLTTAADRICGEHALLFEQGMSTSNPSVEHDGWRDAIGQMIFDMKHRGETIYLRRAGDGRLNATQLFRF